MTSAARELVEPFPAQSAAWAAYYRVRLLAGDNKIRVTGHAALKAAGAKPQKPGDEKEREGLAQACRVAVQGFLKAAQVDILGQAAVGELEAGDVFPDDH